MEGVRANEDAVVLSFPQPNQFILGQLLPPRLPVQPLNVSAARLKRTTVEVAQRDKDVRMTNAPFVTAGKGIRRSRNLRLEADFLFPEDL